MSRNIPIIQCSVCKEDMTEAEIVDNIMTVYNTLIPVLPNEKHNIKNDKHSTGAAQWREIPDGYEQDNDDRASQCKDYPQIKYVPMAHTGLMKQLHYIDNRLSNGRAVTPMDSGHYFP